MHKDHNREKIPLEMPVSSALVPLSCALIPELLVPCYSAKISVQELSKGECKKCVTVKDPSKHLLVSAQRFMSFVMHETSKCKLRILSAPFTPLIARRRHPSQTSKATMSSAQSWKSGIISRSTLMLELVSEALIFMPTRGVRLYGMVGGSGQVSKKWLYQSSK